MVNGNCLFWGSGANLALEIHRRPVNAVWHLSTINCMAEDRHALGYAGVIWEIVAVPFHVADDGLLLVEVFAPANSDLHHLACVTRSELARLNQLNWRNLRGNEARKALIAEVKLLALAHRRARDLGMNWGERRRLIPQRPKIAASDLMESAHG